MIGRTRSGARRARLVAVLAGVVLAISLLVPGAASAQLLEQVVVPIIQDPGKAVTDAINDPGGTVDNAVKGATGTVENIVGGGGGGGGGGGPAPVPPVPPTPAPQPPLTAPGGTDPGGKRSSPGSKRDRKRSGSRLRAAAAPAAGPGVAERRQARRLRAAGDAPEASAGSEPSSPIESLLSAAGSAVVAIAGSAVAGVLGLLLIGTAAALEVQRRRGRTLTASPIRTSR